MIDFYNSNPSRRVLSFTLVELLVVIAIITILAALLMPSLSKAKEISRSAVCISNLKQVGLALYSYASDFKENVMPTVAPYADFWSGASGDRPWYDLLGKFGKYSQLDYGVRIGSYKTNTAQYPKNIMCPSQKLPFDYAADYACNRWFFGSMGSTTYYTHSYSHMQKPSLVSLVMDNGNNLYYGVSYVQASGFDTYDGYALRFNHNGRNPAGNANIVYGDNHVGKVKVTDTGISLNYFIRGFDHTRGNPVN